MRGDIALVMLFNYPGLFNATIEELDAIFPIGTVLAIREPTYAKEVMSNSPTPTIRVECPSDIVVTDTSGSYSQLPMWRTTLPTAPVLPDSGEKWKAMGAKEFKKGRWMAARDLLLQLHQKWLRHGYRAS